MAMAEKAAHPLPLSTVFVSVEKEEEKTKEHAPADPMFLPGVRDVITWVLVHAGCFAVSIAYGIIVTSISHPPSWLRDDAEPEEEMMTDAEVYAAFMAAMLWCVCVVFQAATGALALALPRHRLRLAYAALVATAAGHCMWAGFYIISFVAPRGLSFWTGVNFVAFFISGVGDLLCFRGLIRLRRGEQ